MKLTQPKQSLLLFVYLFVTFSILAQTPDQELGIAVMDGSLEAVQAALDKGANPDALLNEAGHTPLMVAVFNDNIELTKLFLSKKVNVNAQDTEGNSPIISAIFKNNVELVALLIEAKANVNLKNKAKHSPLTIASLHNNKEIIKILKKAGAKK